MGLPFNNKGPKAIDEFKKAIKKDIFFSQAYSGLGKQHYFDKSSDECIFSYEIKLMIDPENKFLNLFHQRIEEMNNIKEGKIDKRD